MPKHIIKKAKEYAKDRLNLIPYYFGGRARPPATIYLAVNSVCNLRCRMCDFGQGNKRSTFYRNLKSSGGMLDITRLKKLIDQAKASRPRIAITSTEPLLYPYIRELVEYIKNAGLEVQLTTNGLLLEKNADWIMKAKVDEVWVSIDGPAIIHDKIRGVKGSQARAIAGIRKILDKRYKLPLIGINYTISDLNQDKLVLFHDEMSRIGFDMMTFSHLNFVTPQMADAHNRLYKGCWPATATSESIPLDKIDAEKLARQINIIKSRHDSRVSLIPDLTVPRLHDFYRRPEKFVTKRRCLMPWLSMQILASGEVTVSTRCFSICFGNVNDDGIDKVWNSRKYTEFRKMLRKDAFPACSRCCGVFS